MPYNTRQQARIQAANTRNFYNRARNWASTFAGGTVADAATRAIGRAASNGARKAARVVSNRIAGRSSGRGSVGSSLHSGDAKQSGHVISGPRVTKHVKGRKRVKVSRKFKSQVNAVLEKKSNAGYYQERYYYKCTPIDNRQNVYDLGQGNYNGETGASGSLGSWPFFDPCRVLCAASVLFNNKTPQGNKAIGDANNFDYRSFSCDVERQWVEINIKNNSARNIEVKLWTWELRKPYMSSAAAFSTEWANSFVTEATATDGKINAITIDPSVIGASPSLSPSMRERFKIEEKIILLEAGKYFKHVVQGPRKTYNFPSYGIATSFNNMQGGNKGVCMAICVDNTSTTLAGANNAGRVTDIAGASAFGILTETIYNYVIRVPEQAGFAYPASTAAGVMQTLKQRKMKPYAIKIWNQLPDTVGTVVEIPDENPQNQGSTGI